MIIFSKVRYKNFFSTGNSFTEIDLLANKRTVVSGKNGDGKSTVFNAITFALFGRPIKNVNKSTIVNSVNRKDCLVEVEFESNGISYLVRRGIKPNILEIEENGVLLDQTAVNDYQTHLETKILKTSFRTFTQTSIISIENYRPFMSLTTRDRREFIEDILDIGVFSTMNVLLKSRLSTTKDVLKLSDVKLKSAKEKVLLTKKHLDELVANKDKGIESFRNKSLVLESEIESLRGVIHSVEEELKPVTARLEELSTKNLKSSEVSRVIEGIKSNISRIEKDAGFFEENNSCPMCIQEIPHEHKKGIISKLAKDKKDFNGSLTECSEKLAEIKALQAEQTALLEKSRELNAKISETNRSISSAMRLLEDNREELNNFVSDSDSIENLRVDLKTMALEAISVQKEKADSNENKSYLESALELLKDSGIKAKIVKQYIPLLNKYLNEYLEKFEFFVSFNLDEEFNETIKSRHRDEFTYENFSRGEKQRIDLSCLFTMRKIAKVKNSFESNLLLFDELLDASFDDEGTELFLQLLEQPEFANMNVIIISHKNKDKLAERFGSLIEFSREGLFSVPKFST